MVNRIKYLVFVILLSIGFIDIYAYNFDNTIKVYDYAQVLTDEEQEELKEQIDSYINKYNIDMVTVISRHYEQPNLESYAKEFYKAYDFGFDDSKSGIMLVIDAKNNNCKVMTFGDAYKFYSNNEIKSIVAKANEKSKYYNKILSFIEYSEKYYENDSILDDKNENIVPMIVLALISSLVISTIIIGIILKNSNRKTEMKDEITNLNEIVINKREDKFITTNTKQL